MTTENLKAANETLKAAIEKLSESLVIFSNEKDGRIQNVLFDAAIKRFEVAFEYAWKLMKSAVEFEGGEAFGPRPAISEAIHYGWIDNPKFWSDALDARNGSVHDYFGITRDAYVTLMNRFVNEVNALIEKINRKK